MVPVMTLPEAVLFPQAIMPLHIFEPRYRAMLKDVLDDKRLFAIAQLDTQSKLPEDFEPPRRTAVLGIVRACHDNPDGTSNLVLQGLCRVRIDKVLQEEPYRTIDISPLFSLPPSEPERLPVLRRDVEKLLAEQRRLGSALSEDFFTFIDSIDDHEAYIDLLAYSICHDAEVKQQLLDNLDLQERYKQFIDYLLRSNEEIRLRKRLQGKLDDHNLDQN